MALGTQIKNDSAALLPPSVRPLWLPKHFALLVLQNLQLVLIVKA